MKIVKKTLAQKLLLVSIFLFIILQVSIAMGSPADTGDPYALMYDSNQRLAEKIEEMPYFEMGDQLYDEDILLDESMFAQSILDTVTADNDSSKNNTTEIDKKEEMKDEVMAFAESGDIEGISQMDELPQELKDIIESEDDSLKQDRYIIKYLTKEDGNISELITGNMKNSDVKDSKREGKIEYLILDEKVNPAELADLLREAGADEEIEYIQPDFKVYFASEEEDQPQEDLDETATDDGSGDESGIDDIDNEEDDTNIEDENTEDSETEENPGEDEEVPLPEEEIEEEVPVEELPIEELLPESSEEVTVAVIDTSVDYTHPGLEDYIWNNSGEIPDDGLDNDDNGYIDDVNGWNFYDDDNEIYDSAQSSRSAHGTHVAGIIVDGAEEYSVKIMPLKVFGENGAYTSDIIDAIHYAEANGVKIVNCSFGSTDNNLALEEAMADSEMLFVCAVGNARSDLEETPIYPACFGLHNIISVTSANADGGLSYYSNYSNNVVDMAALGRDVYSTYPEGEYGKLSGTSMSAAQVSAVAAAVLSVDNILDTDDLKERLINTADMLSNLQETVIDGRQINFDQAVLDEEQLEILDNDPGDDFDVTGYNPTQSQLYQLFTESGPVKQIAASDGFELLLLEDGTVWEISDEINQVLGLSGIIQIAVDQSGEDLFNHCLALKSDGTVWAWGWNFFHQLGDGSITYRDVPVQTIGLDEAVSISAAEGCSGAVESDGTVWEWGLIYWDETFHTLSSPTQKIGIIGTDLKVGGDSYRLALESDGSIMSWGFNEIGQLGNGSFGRVRTYYSTPASVSGLNNSVIQVSAGFYSNLAVKSDGTVWAWGMNWYGGLGDGTTTNRNAPVPVIDTGDPSGYLTGVVQVASGSYP